MGTTVYIAGHRGLVGSAIYRYLQKHRDYTLVGKSHAELDLTQWEATYRFLEDTRPQQVYVCAARVGGILANINFPAEFLRENLLIATHLIHASYLTGVEKLINFGSSCIYPRGSPQPMSEDLLLTGPLEPTNEAYAVAKIAAVKLVRYYNQQYGTRYFTLMPANLYGPGDNFHLQNSHVLAALIRKFHLAKLLK